MKPYTLSEVAKYSLAIRELAQQVCVETASVEILVHSVGRLLHSTSRACCTARRSKRKGRKASAEGAMGGWKPEAGKQGQEHG